MPQYQGVWTLPVAARLQSTQQWATDPLYRNTTLLLQADNAANGAQNNTFIDLSPNNFTITRNSNTTQGTFTPYSATGWSNYFDGSGDALTTSTTNSGWQLGTGDFEIAFWIYPESVTGNRDIFTQRNASGTPQIFLVNNLLRYNNALIAGILDATITIVPNKWQYCVLSRVSGITRWFIDGVAAGSVADTNNWSSTNSWWVSSTAQSFQGYISNLRLVKGSGVTSSTVPTAPLTAISGTTFLSCQSNRFIDSSSNGFQLTTNGNTSVQAFSPFAPQYQWTAPVISGGGYGGAGVGYLLAPASSNFQYPGDYSIETWVYVTTGDYGPIWGTAGGGGADQIYLAGSGSIFYGGSPGFPYFNSASSVVPYAWSHICITRQSGTLRIMINGILIGSRSLATTIGSATTGPGIFIRASLDDQISGPVYMADLRVCKGSVPTSYQTSSTTAGAVIFTPPTQTVTTTSQGATSTDVSLLLNFTNAGIYDGTMKNGLQTVGNAQVSTSVVKYGTGSMAFDGTGDYLTSNAVAGLALYSISATESFTIEMWINRSGNGAGGTSGYDAIIGSNTGTSSILGVYVERSTLKIGFYIGGALYLTSSTISNSAWTHIAVARSFGNLQIFINGVSGYSAANAGASTLVNPLYIGQDGTGASGNNNFNGYIDDLRITKGIARYTANFTPPSVALPRQ